jgi:glycosyltransferase involved in cell wall biosynthesis
MVLPQRLKVLHVVDSLELGGLERVVTDLAIAQRDVEETVTVFSICDTGGHRQTLSEAGIRVIQGGKRRTADVAVLRQLWRAVRETAADVVHAHNFVPNYYAAAALLAISPRPPLVTTCHDMGSRLADRKLRLLFRLSLARTGRVAMVGRQVYQRYVDAGLVGPGMASVILNGVDTARFDEGGIGNVHRRQAARAAIDLPIDSLVIGAVGRLVPLKNHSALIAAMPRLLGDFPQLRLVLAGDGPLREALQAQAKAVDVRGKVRFLGESRDIAAVLPAFDVFAQPSRTEGLSIALLEAAACGLAIVASDVGGNPEIIADGTRGMLIPVDDTDALVECLRQMLAAPALRRRLGEEARAWVLSHCSIGAVCNAYHDCYLAALHAPEPPATAVDVAA